MASSSRSEEIEVVDAEANLEQQQDDKQQDGAVEPENLTEGASAQQHGNKRTRSVANSSTDQSQPNSHKSKVWKDFTIISREGESEVAECKHCKKKFAANTQNGTSSMLRHVKTKHPTTRAEMGNYFLKTEKDDDGSVALKNYKVDLPAVRTGISGNYKWKLHKRIIWFKKLNPPLDGVSIADEVHMCFREWKVDSKIMCMTLDNASYNDRMIATLSSRLMSKGVLPLWGTFFQVRCCAHILNLVVQAGLKLIDMSVDKLRDGIQYIKASYNRMHAFYENAVKIFQLEPKRRLCVDMPIRWNSTYKMIETALYFHPVLEHLSERDSTFKSIFFYHVQNGQSLMP